MHVLAFDACLGAVSAAAGILHADARWECRAGDVRRVSGGHAEALMPMIDAVMRKSGLEFARLDRIVATLGPGGFTGVRVAVAAARGFVLATGARGIGLSTLDALALGARADLGSQLAGRPLAVAVDGRRGMVFFALYEPGIDRAAPALLTAAEAGLRLLGRTRVVVVGSAAQAVAQHMTDASVDIDVCLPDLQPDAALFARLGAGEVPAGSLRPIYLRPPDAKAQTSFILPRATA